MSVLKKKFILPKAYFWERAIATNNFAPALEKRQACGIGSNTPAKTPKNVLAAFLR
ncbi:hypothetical protein [Microcoleus sp. herbarium12]|jgi:hypothetical protein|uniref:hypothetical protein n=1 Tax=Microcoleus sp. herbarium12 TaxID=3055437 RepID=UPI002FD5623D